MKLIDLLVRLYPEEFRARFGREMKSFHAERVGEPRPPWMRIVADHLSAAISEQARALRPDVRYALRGMARRPGFASVVILTVALGVGANAAIFSVVNGVLLRPLPYPDAGRVVVLGHEPPQWLTSEPQFAEYRTHWRSVESLAAYSPGEGTIVVGREPERVALARVTRELFATLGVAPALGRGFAQGEDEVRPAEVVIVSHRLWARRFASDPGIVGRTILLSGARRTVIGVMPEGFEYPSAETALWVPHCSQRECRSLSTMSPDERDGWANHYLFVIGRMREGVSASSALSEVAAIARRIMAEHPNNFDPGMPLTPNVTPLRDSLLGSSRPYLVAMLGAVGFLLLIACANVANLLLARGEGRRREMALRTAIGASRRRLITQVATESMVLAALGGIVGLALAWAGSRGLLALAPASLPRLDQVGVDWMVVAFCFAVSLAAGLLFGVLPALAASREAPAEALKSGGKGTASGGGSGRARAALVVAEVALAMVLLTGAAMLTRSLLNLQSIDLGFRPTGVLTAKVSLGSDYDDERAVLFYE